MKLKLQYFGYLMQRADLFEKTPVLGKIEGRRRREQQRMRWSNSIPDSMDTLLLLLLLSLFNHIKLSLTSQTAAHQAPPPRDSPSKKTTVGCHFLLQCMHAYILSRFSHVQPRATPWTAAQQAPLSMGFSRQEYWSGLPLPSPQWTWVWAYSRRQWMTGEAGMLQSMELHSRK